MAALFLPRLSGNQREEAQGDTAQTMGGESSPQQPRAGAWRLLLTGGLEVQGAVLGSSCAPTLSVQEFPGIQSFPSRPKQQEPGAGGHSGVFLAGSSPSLSRAEAAEGAALAGHGPGFWHLSNLGPIVPWQLRESSRSKEGRAAFPIPFPFLSLSSLHLFHVRAGLTPFPVPLLG